MRSFNEADKNKKKKRIEIPDNPTNLSPEELTQLENNVKASLKDGYLPCPAAWTIAKNANVPKIAVGAITDKLGIRVTDCQLGYFKVDKTVYSSPANETLDSKIIDTLKSLDSEKNLTCEKAFEISAKFKQKPMVIGNEASARNLKIRQCQLGCF